jgi:ribosomal protein L31E
MSREASASVTDRSEVSQVSEVEQSYLEAIRSVKTFQEVLQRHINGNAYSTRTIDPSLNTVFWAAGVRSTELKIELEHWWLVQTELNDQCGAHQARRIASSIVLGNTAISAMEDAATIAQQTALSEEDVAEALRKAYEDAETSSEEEDGTNGFNGFNGNGHHASALGSPMDTNA